MYGTSVLDDASRDVSSIAATDALLVLAVLLSAAGAAACWLGGRPVKSWSAQQWFAGMSTLAIIVAVTLFRDGIAFHLDVSNLGEWSSHGIRRLSRDPLGSSQFVLNVVLFVPAGVAWTLLTRRPLLVLAALSTGSLMIECIQAMTGAGANDLADVVANSIGAVLGVGGAGAFGSSVGARTWSSRRRSVTAAVGFVLGSAIVSAWLVGASHRQDRVAVELQAEFAGTTRSDVLALLDSDPERVFGAVEARADGTEYLDTEVVVRYPATFFGLHRCVYVVWTDRTVSFEKSSGHDCTRFLG